MLSFSSVLVSGGKRPYDSWTFVVVPEQVVAALGSKRAAVRGTIAGERYKGSVSKGEGVYRMAVGRAFLDKVKLARGDKVRVSLELDPEPRLVAVPIELREVLAANPGLSKLFDGLPAAHRRAWASHVADAKGKETRTRRAAKAPDGIRNKRFPGG